MANRDSDEKFDKGKWKQTIAEQEKGEPKAGSGGQPIGGNSQTGSGTTLTQGYGGAGGTSSTTGAGVGTPGAGGPQSGGQSAAGQAQPGAGSAPPRSMGTHGDEFGQMSDYDRSGQQGQSGTGQADLGSQAGSTLAGRSDQQDLGPVGGEVDQPASYGGGIGERQSNTEGEGFILQQGSGSDDLQQRESPSSAEATGGTDFAAQGRGALEGEEEDVEGAERSNPRSDVEQD